MHDCKNIKHKKILYFHLGDTGLRGPVGEAGIPGTKGTKGDQGD